jgi:hypothetical protein
MTLEQYEPIDAAKLKALERQVAEYRKQIKAGRDPLAERDKLNAAASNAVTAVTRANADTFEDVARDYIAFLVFPTGTSKKRLQWRNTERISSGSTGTLSGTNRLFALAIRKPLPKFSAWLTAPTL